MNPSTVVSFRGQMPVCDRYAYFDHAAVSPLPAPARDAIQQWLNESVESGDAHWPSWAQRVEQARQVAAEGLNATTEEIAFVSSTTEGVTFAAEGLDWREGDNVVVLDNEFPTNIYPWQNLASRGVQTILAPATDRPSPKHLLAACTPRTRLISVSWVGFATGWRFDLDALVEAAHQRGVLVFLDAIQGLGVFPLDVRQTAVDFLAADGHKWMLGPEGAGIFYLRREHLERMRPLKVGWNSMTQPYDFSRIHWQLRPDARRYEGGSQNMVGVHALGASLRLLRDAGWGPQDSDVATRILDYTDLACERLQSAGAKIHSIREADHRSGIVSFDLPGKDSTELRERAVQADVILSCRNDRLRIAAHAYNDESDLDRLIDALVS